MEPAATLRADERAGVQPCERRLRVHSDQARALAKRGTAATAAAIQTALDRELMAQTRRVGREHRTFARLSNIIGTEHDAARSAIGTMR